MNETKEIDPPRLMRPCPVCGGSRRCPVCGGSCFIINPETGIARPCPACGGNGGCFTCGGAGVVP